MSLSGKLTDLSFAELIEFFCNQKKTGRLEVICLGGRGEFYLSDGSIMHAEIGILRGTEAVLYALTLRDASFSFEGSVVAPEQTIGRQWAPVVLEGLRQLDEGAKPAEAFPDCDEPQAVEFTEVAPAVESLDVSQIAEWSEGFVVVQSRDESPVSESGEELPVMQCADEAPAESRDELPVIEASDAAPAIEARDELPTVELPDELPPLELADIQAPALPSFLLNPQAASQSDYSRWKLVAAVAAVMALILVIAVPWYTRNIAASAGKKDVPAVENLSRKPSDSTTTPADNGATSESAKKEAARDSEKK